MVLQSMSTFQYFITNSACILLGSNHVFRLNMTLHVELSVGLMTTF